MAMSTGNRGPKAVDNTAACQQQLVVEFKVGKSKSNPNTNLETKKGRYYGNIFFTPLLSSC
jgi:hypothetical protein